MSKARSPSVEQLTFIFVQAGLASAPVRVRHYPNSVCGNILQRAEESRSRLFMSALRTSSRLGKGSRARARL